MLFPVSHNAMIRSVRAGQLDGSSATDPATCSRNAAYGGVEVADRLLAQGSCKGVRPPRLTAISVDLS
jgi:hypothetical protein